ncbi:MAG: polysaccharide deacetylase family protein [bacterium]
MNKFKKSAIIFFILGMGLFILSSCATLAPQRAPMIFKSDEYIIYELQKEETPEILAERFLGDREKSWMIEDFNEKINFKSGEIIVIPLKERNIGGVTTKGFQVVPILSYHRFSEKCDNLLCVPTHIFDKQMNYLKTNGYRGISLKELLDFVNYRHPLPRKSVVITVDDGYQSVYDIAYPILKKYGFTASLFIYTDFIGISDNAITWDQLRKLKNEGFEIGAHTVSHCDLTKRRKGENDQAYTSRIEKELLVSKNIIDKELRQNTIFLAFPYGRYNTDILSICEKLNYKLGVSVERGSNPFFADPLALKRNQMLKRDMETFISRLKTFEEF